MYCKKCGNLVSEGQKFCMNCGNEINHNINMNKMSQTKIIIIVVATILVFFILPMIVISSVDDNISTQVGDNINVKSNEINNNKSLETNKTTDTEVVENNKTTDILINNIKTACEEIGIDFSQISDFTKKEIEGNPVISYTFRYKDYRFNITPNLDNTIDSIYINSKVFYKQGYEPLNVNDYLVPYELTSLLQVKAQDSVKLYGGHSNLSFPLVNGYTFGRYKNTYSVGGYGTKTNILGEEYSISFHAEYELKDDKKFSLVYLEVDGKNKFGSESKMNTPELVEKKAVSEVKEEDESIILIDGTMGEYGKVHKISGIDFIDYFVPAGKYKIVPITQASLVFLNDVKIKKNSDGTEETITYKTYRFSNPNEEDIIEVKSNMCIALGLGTKIKLIPIK